MNTKERLEEARFLGERSTPRSEQRRSAWGSLLASVQTVKGLCPARKCVLKEGHEGACWPKEN